jgi:hypothetical protein
VSLIRFATENSVYEVDVTNKRVRRLVSTHEPTPRQGADGEWKEFASMSLLLAVGECVFFDWDDFGHGTLTSPVVEILRDEKESSWVSATDTRSPARS